MAFKPAPIQVCYHNLVSTTGLDAIDYMITEEATDPAGIAEPMYIEKLVRLSERNCYAAPPDCPDVSPAPSSIAGAVTFGSFNNVAKITPDVVVLWARVLHALPEARLALKNIVPMSAPDDWSILRSMFTAAGISADRITFIDYVPERSGHLAAYRDIDIALDTFPCNGGTTSCDALWMGVPIVTRTGPTFMNRQSEVYLTKLGLPDLITSDDEGYITAAVALAHDPARRTHLRRTLRADMQRALLPYDRHVRELEDAFEQILDLAPERSSRDIIVGIGVDRAERLCGTISQNLFEITLRQFDRLSCCY
ncbi:MAG: Tetratricopeptide 1 repeat-containing protein [Rhodospirillales bacterium]|nr:Tetratricopeptide 1 repeat-containing protein [Rhodospirillales bacterium]